MNDRASNAPPPDFLGLDADTTADYERQFALDWQPPDLGLRHHGTRNSFMSVNSAVSSATTARKQNGPSFLAPLWGGVKERLSLNRSKSSNNVHDRDEDSTSHGHFIPPAFKHQRSESVNVARRSRHADPDSLAATGDGARLKKFPSAAAIPGVSMPMPLPSPPAFDPTKRPTPDEIAANYQSLLASGFFGNRTIQSTRFARPGQMQDPSSLPTGDSFFAQRSAGGDQQEQHQDTPVLPPPERQPPPPPPNRAAPPPPPPGESMDSTRPSSSAGALPSPPVMFQPGSKEQQQASRDMPPPPSPPKQRKPGHKQSQSFSSVPYDSIRPTNEPSVSRPFRPPPVSLARFSLDSGRRSFDFRQGNDSNRGTKRPFTATNDSDMSLHRPSYDIINGDGSGSMVTASDDGGHESGARKLVKKLRKSASRISMDLGKTISRPASSNFDSNDGDVEITDSSSSLPRKSMSSSIRRSFSWRLGRAVPDNKDDSRHGDAMANGESMEFAAEAPAAPSFQNERFIPPSLSVIMDAPESPERNKLKKKDIRGRRLRRQEASSRSFPAPPHNQGPSPFLSPPGDGDVAMTMDWQSTRHSDGSKSRSRSRPRRSELSMMMMQSQSQPQPPSQPQSQQSQSRPGTAHSTESSFSFTTSSAAASFEPRRSAEVAGADDRMDVEPVEFVIPSFHFPNRVRPGNPLTVIPDANRGIPSVPNIPGVFRDVKIVARDRAENVDDDVDVGGGGNGGPSGGTQAAAWPSPQAVS